MKFHVLKRVATVAVLATALGGCSTVKGWFGGKDAAAKAATEPAELVKLENTIKVERVWTAKAGDGEQLLGTQQGPAVADGRVYAAAIEGGVRAFELQNGNSVWRYETEALVSSVGAGDGLVVAGTLDGDVIALDATTGSEKWKAKVNNEVIAPATIGQGTVVVHSNDGQVTAYDAASGERRWFWSHEQPTLTVRGNGPVTLGPSIVFVGNDDGTVAARGLGDGRALWEQTVAAPEGRTELDRMSDVDGAPVLEGTTLYATSFKRKTVAIDGPTGRPLWTRDNGGAGGLGLSGSSVVVADPAGSVWALDRSSGGSLWSNTTLARRSLTAPTVHGDYAVVGDLEGYVHWLRLDDGAVAARERAGRDAIRAKPVLADGLLIVQNVDGKLSAFRLP